MDLYVDGIHTVKQTVWWIFFFFGGERRDLRRTVNSYFLCILAIDAPLVLSVKSCFVFVTFHMSGATGRGVPVGVGVFFFFWVKRLLIEFACRATFAKQYVGRKLLWIVFACKKNKKNSLKKYVKNAASCMCGTLKLTSISVLFNLFYPTVLLPFWLSYPSKKRHLKLFTDYWRSIAVLLLFRKLSAERK